MRLSDIMESDSIEDLLSDDPLEDALEDMLEDGDLEVGFLGKLVKGIAKGVKAVGKVALPIVKMVPGVGNVVSAAETGINIADKLGAGKLIGKALDGKKKGAPAAPKKKISMSASPAVVQASVRAAKSKPALKKAVVVAKPSSSTKAATPRGAAQAVAIQPSVVVKAEPLDISRIVGNFSASVSPQLNAIAGLLKQQQLQAQAQSEHNKRVKDAAFKRHVVKQLAVKQG